MDAGNPGAIQQLALFKQECKEYQKSNAKADLFGMSGDGRLVAQAGEKNTIQAQQERLRSTLLEGVADTPLTERQTVILSRLETKMSPGELSQLIDEFTQPRLEKISGKTGSASAPDEKKIYKGPMQPAPDFGLETFQLEGKARETCRARKDLEHFPGSPYQPNQYSRGYSAEDITRLEYRVVTDPVRIEEKLNRAKTTAIRGRNASEPVTLYRFQENPGPQREVSISTVPEFPDAAIATAKNSRQGDSPNQDRFLLATFSFAAGGQTWPVAIAGVFDGHNGAGTADLLQENLAHAVKGRLESLNQGALTQAGIWNALKLALVDLDRMELRPDGSTACVSLVINGYLWTINVGDSRAVLPVHDKAGLQLSADHKAKAFTDRHVDKRGGVSGVDAQGVPRAGLRVPESMISRAIGDHSESSALSARGTITSIELPDAFHGARLVIASDGVFDVLSSNDVIHLTNNLGYEKAEDIANQMVLNSIARGAVDDITAVVIPVKNMLDLTKKDQGGW